MAFGSSGQSAAVKFVFNPLKDSTKSNKMVPELEENKHNPLDLKMNTLTAGLKENTAIGDRFIPCRNNTIDE